MISLKVEVNQIFRNDGDDCLKAKVLTTGLNLRVDAKYKSISVYGKYPECMIKKGTYQITISDFPSDKGHYKIICLGRLPRKEVLDDLGLLVFENGLNYPDDYDMLWEFTRNLSISNHNIIIEYLRKRNKYVADDYSRKYLNENKDVIRKLSRIYRKAEETVAFRCELEKMNILDENIHFKILKNIKGDFQKVIEALRVNPYLLIDMADMKLEVVDEIALDMNVDADDENRIAAITEMNLRALGAEGKTWVTKDYYMNILNEMYSYDTANYVFKAEYLRQKIDEFGDRPGFYLNIDKERIASSEYYLLEEKLSKIIQQLSTHNSLDFSEKTITTAIKNFEKTNNIILLKEQRDAVYNSFQSDFAIIAGAAGTGKTTIAKVASDVHQKVVVTALSGKATLRISETTQISGANSRTMHSFSNISDKYISADLIIVDEVSMVGLDIAIEFFSKVKPGTHVMLLGDNCQLAPIGAGNFFSDLLHCSSMNVSIIEEVHRQALDSTIVKFATNVRHQICNKDMLQNKILDDFEMHLVTNNKEIANKAVSSFKEYMNSCNVKDIMVVSPQKNSAYVVNNAIQNILREERMIGDELVEISAQWDYSLKFKICQGDRVINIENYHDCPTQANMKIAVMNGSLGTVLGKKEVKNQKGEIIKTVYEIDFDGIGIGWYSKSDLKRKILLGYAITVHKSQGSQAKVLIYIHPDKCYSKLNCSEMVYTAVTRAREKAIVISIENVLEKAIVTKELNAKQTLLKEFLDTGLSVFEKKYAPNGIEEDKKLPETDICVDAMQNNKLREIYDKNNIRRKLLRRNDNLINKREQAKVDNMMKVQSLFQEGKKNKEIVEITGLTKGTVSKYINIDINAYIDEQITKAHLKKTDD